MNYIRHNFFYVLCSFFYIKCSFRGVWERTTVLLMWELCKRCMLFLIAHGIYVGAYGIRPLLHRMNRTANHCHNIAKTRNSGRMPYVPTALQLFEKLYLCNLFAPNLCAVLIFLNIFRRLAIIVLIRIAVRGQEYEQDYFPCQGKQPPKKIFCNEHFGCCAHVVL